MNRIKCPHMDNVLPVLPANFQQLRNESHCHECEAVGPNFWMCLQQNCLQIGCPENVNDHNTLHFRANRTHAIHMNVSSQRLWCYLCEKEVFFPGTTGALGMDSERHHVHSQFHDEATTMSGNEEMIDYGTISNNRRQFGGLVGLKNLANTCYMNAALQALSNTPPLTGYFLDCGSVVETLQMHTPQQKKSELAKGYLRLVKEMWCRNRRSNGYVVPTAILHGIRMAHPMFRGYQQHDTQEFLRCFMDQLHEELKEVTPPPPRDIDLSRHRRVRFGGNGGDENDRDSNCSSPAMSEAEYETCDDSGVSEQSQLSDLDDDDEEGDEQQQHQSSNGPMSKYSRSNSPRRNARLHSGQSTASSSSAAAATTTPKEPPKSHRSIISDVFDGKLLSSVQCLTCDRFSNREETFQDLSLPIPGKDHLAVLHQSQSNNNLPSIGLSTMSTSQSSMLSGDQQQMQASQDGWFWWLWGWMKSWFWGPPVTLHDCMAAFFSADELKNDNMYSCEKCKKLRNGIKFSRVLALPEMLCVHLKRFRHDLSFSSKISSPVHFPLAGLDMRPYLHKDCRSEVSTYDLTAVICHHGTVGCGHYTCYAKHEPTGNWFEYDDQLVTKVQPETVQNCQPYVLFYRKTNAQMEVLRAQAMELVDRGPPLASDIRFFVSKSWFNRFNTFAEPGPIDNWALLCPHGGLPPCKAGNLKELVMPLPQPLWDFLYETFGGGPACNRLFECKTCKRAAESLTRRQNEELDIFTELMNVFHMQEPSTIYAISMHWFRQWQLFARGMTTDEPGQVNNTSIAAQTSDTQPIRNVRPGSDYAQIGLHLWRFFHGVYGGGPEIMLRGNAQTVAQEEANRYCRGREEEEEETEDQENEIEADEQLPMTDEQMEVEETENYPEDDEEEVDNLLELPESRNSHQMDSSEAQMVVGEDQDGGDREEDFMENEQRRVIENGRDELPVNGKEEEEEEVVGDQPSVFGLTNKLKQEMSLNGIEAEDENASETTTERGNGGQGDTLRMDDSSVPSGGWVNGTMASGERSLERKKGKGTGSKSIVGGVEKKDKHRKMESSGLFGADGTFVSHSTEMEERTSVEELPKADECVNVPLLHEMNGGVDAMTIRTKTSDEAKKPRNNHNHHHHGKGKHRKGRKN